MMLHQDGSTHEWVAGQHWDLIVTLDDANNHILSAFFVEQEGTWSSLRAVEEVIAEHLPAAGRRSVLLTVRRPGLALLPHPQGRRQGR